MINNSVKIGLIICGTTLFNISTNAQVVQDPYFSNQYYLEMINVIDAWDITKGDPSVIVTITDEPLETNHEDINSSRIVQLYGGAALENRAHGMAVGGIMFADHNNKGIAGIAPNVSIIGIATRNIFGPTNDATLKNLSIDAFEDGSRLFNHSWTSEADLTQYPNFFITQINYANIVHIAAAGNKNIAVEAPANYSEMYAVGAVDQSLNRWNWSNFGPELRIVGPNGEIGENILEDHPCYDGVNSVNAGLQGLKMRGDIWTLDLTGQSGYNPGNLNVNTIDCWGNFEHQNTPISNTNYNSDFSGTSANAPMVTGTVALMLSVNPNLNRGQVYSILDNTAVKVPAMGSNNFSNFYGYGMLDAYAAVKEALPEQFDNNTFTASTTINSAHIDGNTTLESGVTLTIAANEVAVLEGSITGAATNTHLNVQGKLIIDYNTDLSRIHLEVEDGGELLIRSGTTFELSTGQWNNIWVKPGGKITAKGTLSNPIVIKQLDSGTRWSQIGLQSSETNTFEWVVFDGGNKTVGIASQNNIFKHCTFKNGVRGISGWHNQDGSGQSHATISYSKVENNSTVGVVAQYADIEMFHTDIKNNGQAGLYVHSSTVYPFHRNDVSNNGTNYSRDGIEVLSSGNILLQDSNGSQPTPGYNVIANNSDDQISVSGQATLGFAINYTGGYNSITGPYGYSNRYLVDNNTSTALQAMFNYWGGNLSSSMFDGGLSKLYNEEYFLTNDDDIDDENPGYQLISKSALPQFGFASTDELYDYYLSALNEASSKQEIRFNLTQMYLASRATKNSRPQLLQSFREFLLNNSDANQNRYGDIRRNKALRDISRILNIKSKISDGDYLAASEYIDMINPSLLEGKDRLDYYHSKIATESFAGNYRKSYIALQQYYRTAERLNMDMEEIRVLNSIIEEDLNELLNQHGIQTKDLIIDEPELDLSAYPNPFNPSTYISFSIPNQTHVTLKVYDLLGREVAELINEQRNAGPYNVFFDASGLASGVYLYKLTYDNQVISKTMTLIK